MRSSCTVGLLACLFAGVAGAAALPRIDFPKDSPVAFLSSDGDSTETARGGAMVIDLHSA
jgi:hypothetical protein